MNKRYVYRHPLSGLLRGTLFMGLWFVFNGLDPQSLMIGIPTVIAATIMSMRLSPPRKRTLSVIGSIRFAPYFLWESLLGAIDVAARVLWPRMAVNPGFHSYRTRLRNPSARLVFIDSISLLPGTLSADLRGDVVEVHALDREADLDLSLSGLERQVAILFNESLEEIRTTPHPHHPSPEPV
ncbi:hypothetical protein CKO25_13985 [Thiocapsa imhoffii]|uniref:Cation transporter n=1 Tax=Thiocapsa imhoffii TaxID=382777 RepID=A0A9X1BA50_9GAMM|nr:Na+/H+ antiporter subunit E [Thiocapsa imhoffii]MBK1645740.1 hypothetical protein [Thiocapsa imhoffii]